MAERSSGATSRGPGAHIAGPRRAWVKGGASRLATPTRAIVLEPVAAWSDVGADASSNAPTVPFRRALLALDYDEPTLDRPALDERAADAAIEAAPSSPTAPRAPGSRRFAWGVAVGALVVSLAHAGDGEWSRAVRSWGAGALRSMEQRPSSIDDVRPPPATAPTPCAMTAEDCERMLAPHAPPSSADAPTTPAIPLVNVDDLPLAVPKPIAPRPAVARRAKRLDAPSTPASADDAAPPAPSALPRPDDILDAPAPPRPAKPPPFDTPAGAETGKPVATALRPT